MVKHLKKISKYRPSQFQGRLSFAVSQRRASLAVEHPYERMAMSGVSIALVVLACAYLYFVAASTLNVMARKEALSQISQLQGSMGGLEQQYFELSQEVSPQAAATLGLVPLSSTQYVYRPGNVGQATVATHEI